MSLVNNWTGGWSKDISGVFMANGLAVPNVDINLVLEPDFIKHRISAFPNTSAKPASNGKYIYEYNASIIGASYPLQIFAMYYPSWAYDIPQFNNFIWNK
ncbi:MAG: hypothetical protein AAF620_14790 [Bacteroidota bacterium]